MCRDRSAVRLLVAAALLCPMVGCNWMREWREKGENRPTGRIPPAPTAVELVQFLNWRASQLQSVEYENVRMRVSGKDLPLPVTLDGSLAAAQPRYFRLKTKGRVAGAVDMGSNPEQFWAHVFTPNEAPLVVAASHADLESGRARMPGGLPFEPDWVLQALGMTTYPPTNNYTVEASDRDRTYTLGWNATTPSGVPVRKEVVIDADNATGARSQVKRHVVRDTKNKLIAAADVRAAEVARVGQDAQGRPMAVQYPTHVVMKWEDPRFEMDLTLERATVNAILPDDPARRALFTRPAVPGR